VILLFGGNGQLGRELTALAQRRDVPLSSLTRAEADIADPIAVARAIDNIRPNLVVNAAAYTNVDMAECQIELAQHCNAVGPSILAELCSRHRIALLHISTDYVFDGRQSTPYRESDPIAPINVYGLSKAAGECAIRDRLSAHVILRTSWLYGAYGHNILKTILKLARERNQLRFVSDQRGCPTSTKDLAEAILCVAQQLTAGKNVWGTYHFTGTGVATWYDFAQYLVSVQAPVTGRCPDICPIASCDFPSAARRPLNSVLDSSLFTSTFGMRAKPWRTQVKRTVEKLLIHSSV